MIQTPNKEFSSSFGMSFSTLEFSLSQKSPSYSSTSRSFQAKTSDWAVGFSLASTSHISLPLSSSQSSNALPSKVPGGRGTRSFPQNATTSTCRAGWRPFSTLFSTWLRYAYRYGNSTSFLCRGRRRFKLCLCSVLDFCMPPFPSVCFPVTNLSSVTIVSIVRLQSLASYATTSNVTREYSGSFNSSIK